MKYIFLGYLALYWTIWLHELGHSYMYKKYGCKKESFIKVKVPFTLFFSTPEPIDSEKAKSLNKKQIFYISIAGVMVNIILGIICGLSLIIFPITSEANLILLYSFAVFNFTEAATYLVINNLSLASDMKGVADYNPKLRIPAFFIGLASIASIVYLLYTAPLTIAKPIAVISVLIALSMSVGRIIFEKKQAAN